MKIKVLTAVSAALIGSAGLALADPDEDQLVINGDLEIVTEAAAPDHLSDVMDTIYSGWRFRSDETQELEMDDFDNPGMIFVDQAMDSWASAEGSEGKSCASCHGDDPSESMAGSARSIPSGMPMRPRSGRWRCRSTIAAKTRWAPTPTSTTARPWLRWRP